MSLQLSIDTCRSVIRARNTQLGALLRVLDEPERDPGAPRDAPLAGVPYVLKDTWDTAGIPTTGGSWRHRERIPAESSRVHRAFERAGAVLLGKSNLSDLALAWITDNHLVGKARNPFDPSRNAGGSTGGGAAAVATGMGAFDWGSDFGGSIRQPAGFCGVVGLRLSAATWPVNEEHFPRLSRHFWPWVGMGPIARTVDDARTVMRAAVALRGSTIPWRARTGDAVVVLGPDARSRGAWPTFVDDAILALHSLQVPFEVARHGETLPSPSRASAVYNGYLCSHFEEFASSGELPVAQGIGAVLLALLTAGRLDRRVHPTSAALLAAIAAGRWTLYRDPARWEDRLARVREDVRAVWQSGRLLVAPTSTSMPPRHARGLLDPTMLAFTKLGNLVDATAVAVPFGRFATGLPRSIQILGPPGSEEEVLAFAARLGGAARPSQS